METEAHSGVVLGEQAHINCGKSVCLKEEMAPETVNTEKGLSHQLSVPNTFPFTQGNPL